MHKAFSDSIPGRGFLFTPSSTKDRKSGMSNIFFPRISMFGVNNEKDETNQKYIIQMNLISVVTFVINAFTGILFLFIHEPWPALVSTLGASIWLLPMYFNRNGLNILSRAAPVFLTAATIVLASCWFSHNTFLDNYLLIVAINCGFMYSHKERKWQMICISFCLILFIIESTSLQNYLPARNAIKNISSTNIILLVGQILNIIMDVIIYAYLNRLRETYLLAKQKELREIQKRLEIQNEDVKAFSIAASHNMQTPLYVASFFLRKVNSEIAPVSTDLKKNLELIDNGLQQIDQLVSGLFSYNKIINIENEREQIEIAKEISIVKKNIMPHYATAEIIIESDEQTIITNRMLFSIIVYNLIDNGSKYNRSLLPRVNISFTVRDEKAIIMIRDNGIGIPTEQFAQIFKPFHRIQTGLIVKAGNGLGLASARRAAERIGGDLICLDSTNKGSIFKLEIPAK